VSGEPRQRRYPLRFVWQMDEDGRFTLDSDEFVALVGPRAAAAVGQRWQDLAAELGLDPEGGVARAIASRETWSGLRIFWPLDASPERLAVELSGLPVFDRDRVFRGYRGFGVCRALVPTPSAENIVPFRSAAAEPSTPALSPVERNAFHELSRKLAQRLASASIAPRGDGDASIPGAGHGPVAPAGGTPARALAAAVPSPVPAGLDSPRAEIARLGARPDTAQRASSAISDFLARVSHEIRAPLAAIIGFSEIMMEECFGPIGNERYREYLEDIHAAGGHLLSLINDLLDLSEIEAGTLELTFASVSLNQLTRQCVAIMQPQANRARVIIRTSLPPTLPQIVADARSVRQIVLKLLSNSIKFTGAGGQVIVSTALNDNGEVALRVRDTGIGMSEKDLVAALAPFRQLATSMPGGTGLGLPLTKALAEANRASFHIKSAPSAGTLVEIAFPASRVLAG
jgi:anti-sigma regulatory factor (Ser/Thr protein kinase)